ncbi:hypothetical protein J7L13_03770 [bacterium]|nr:hypothetical protein [bacterium]
MVNPEVPARGLSEEQQQFLEKLKIDLENALLRELENVTLPRASAIYFIERGVKRYEELNAPTKEEGEKKFAEIARRTLAENLVVHGVVQFERLENGEVLPVLLNYGDLDGKGALFLLREAGVDTSKVEYVFPGEAVPGKVNIDTGEVFDPKFGLVVKKIEDSEGRKVTTLFLDHHGPKAEPNTSATKIVYRMLTELGLLKRRASYERFVRFITEMDNVNYILSWPEYEQSHRTLRGIARFLSPRQIWFVLAPEEEGGLGKNPDEILSEEDFSRIDAQDDRPPKRRISAKEASERHERVIRQSRNRLKMLQRFGAIYQSPEYGTVVIDFADFPKEGKKPIGGGFDAVKAWVNGAEHPKKQKRVLYIRAFPKTNSFFISAGGQRLPEAFLPWGRAVRNGIYWICEASFFRGEKANTKMAEALRKVGITPNQILNLARAEDRLRLLKAIDPELEKHLQKADEALKEFLGLD